MKTLTPGEFITASNLKVTEGYTIRSVLSSDLDTYARDFLKLFNVSREQRGSIIQVMNNSYNNGVDVVVTEDSKDPMIEYMNEALEKCTIMEIYKCLIVEDDASFDYDIDTYEGLYVKRYVSDY